MSGEERFDADAVLEWLELTGRGNNPDVRADCAAFASPKGMSTQDDEIVFDGLAALLCLKGISGARPASLTDDDLLDLADEADPDDEFLMSEISALGPRLRPLRCYADTPADAATTAPRRSSNSSAAGCVAGVRARPGCIPGGRTDGRRGAGASGLRRPNVRGPTGIPTTSPRVASRSSTPVHPQMSLRW